jgi:glutamine phosphoribosylpyrophosphate amidotransferase
MRARSYMKSLSGGGLQEKCAVFGTFGTGEEAARTTFYGLWALQHRGQESSGSLALMERLFIGIRVLALLLAYTAKRTSNN